MTVYESPAKINLALHIRARMDDGDLADPAAEQPRQLSEQAGESYQITREGELFVLRGTIADQWTDLYAFRPEPALPVVGRGGDRRAALLSHGSRARALSWWITHCARSEAGPMSPIRS